MNALVRRIHRWMSVAFTAGVLVNVAAIAVVGQDTSAGWVGTLAALPLFLLLVTGLYLFVLPWAARWRRGRSASSAGAA